MTILSFMQRTFVAGLAAFALSLATGIGAPAQAADLRVVAGPGLLYEFDRFDRRGAAIVDNGLLEVRIDGCWNAQMSVENSLDFDRTVSITVQFYNPHGRLVASVPVASHVAVGPVSIFEIDSNGCNPALARAFTRLQSYGVRRVFSIR